MVILYVFGLGKNAAVQQSEAVLRSYSCLPCIDLLVELLYPCTDGLSRLAA